MKKLMDICIISFMFIALFVPLDSYVAELGATSSFDIEEGMLEQTTSGLGRLIIEAVLSGVYMPSLEKLDISGEASSRFHAERSL